MRGGHGAGGGRGRGMGRGRNTARNVRKGCRKGAGSGRRGQWNSAPRIPSFGESARPERGNSKFEETARGVFNRLRSFLVPGPEKENVYPEEPVPQNFRSRKLPERKTKSPEIAAAVNEDRCTGCGICADVCPEHAVSVDAAARIDPVKCLGCGACAHACPQEAIFLYEKKKSGAM